MPTVITHCSSGILLILIPAGDEVKGDSFVSGESLEENEETTKQNQKPRYERFNKQWQTCTVLMHLCHDMSASFGPPLKECASSMHYTNLYSKSRGFYYYDIPMAAITDLKFQVMLPFSPTKFPYAHVRVHQHHRRHSRDHYHVQLLDYLWKSSIKLRAPHSNPREPKLRHTRREKCQALGPPSRYAGGGKNGMLCSYIYITNMFYIYFMH